ncbi:hypothetical protein JCM11491_004307, partial [Sporobolomyces phaffii]
MSLSTPRQRASARRGPHPPHLALALASSSPASTRSVSVQSVPSYQPSIASHTTATRSRYAPSATTANPTRRFTRGHARTKYHASSPSAGISSANPDLVDLMALDDPDVVFRTFGVRDVRKIEQRASDAANAKVAELRTMVGERYRDLLAAADSIVRMRSAADKLLDRLEGVEFAVSNAQDAIRGPSFSRPSSPSLRPGLTPFTVRSDPPSQRRPSLLARPSDPAHPRTLADPPTLSLTLHLFLNLSSHVHALIEQSKFLEAARFENLGRVVWQEIEAFRPSVGTDAGPVKSVHESFPIIVRHHEGMRLLAPLIVKRATAELRSPNLAPS